MIDGVVRVKATPGLMSKSAVIPISYNLRTVESFLQRVADAVSALDAIAGSR